MKIKEAVDTINKLDTVRADLSNGDIEISDRQAMEDDWFLEVSARGESLFDASTDYDALIDSSPQDLKRVFDILQELLDTPVKERFPEKRFHVKIDRGFPWPEYISLAFNQEDKFGFKLTSDKEEAVTFAKSELDSFPFTLKFETEEADE